MLVENLPHTAAVARAYRGHNWSDINYQLADLLDAVNWLLFLNSNGKGKKPTPFPRPDKEVQKARRREQSSASVLAYIEHYRQRREG